MVIDCTSKGKCAELHPRAKRAVAAEFLRRVRHKLLNPQAYQSLPGGHRFDRVCRAYGVEHWLTKPVHPWTNGQVERINRTIQDGTG